MFILARQSTNTYKHSPPLPQPVQRTHSQLGHLDDPLDPSPQHIARTTHTLCPSQHTHSVTPRLLTDDRTSTRTSSPSTRTINSGACPGSECGSTGPKCASKNHPIFFCHGPMHASAWTCACKHPDVTATHASVAESRRAINLHLTDAGLLSIPANNASVASAIMSLAALDVHSSVTSCSDVCFTSTTFITLLIIS